MPHIHFLSYIYYGFMHETFTSYTYIYYGFMHETFTPYTSIILHKQKYTYCIYTAVLTTSKAGQWPSASMGKLSDTHSHLSTLCKINRNLQYNFFLY